MSRILTSRIKRSLRKEDAATDAIPCNKYMSFEEKLCLVAFFDKQRIPTSLLPATRGMRKVTSGSVVSAEFGNIILGFLASNVSRLAKTQESAWERESGPKEYKCFCGEEFARPIQLASHTKRHISELRNEKITKGVDGLRYFKSNYPNSENYPTLDQINGWTAKFTKD